MRVRKQKEKSRFFAMSKLLCIVIFIVLGIILIYTMVEMHQKGDLSALPQLLISIFALASVYVGFYLTMAKIEHIEYERTKRQEQLRRLKRKNNMPEEEINNSAIQDLQEDIDNYQNATSNLLNNNINNNNLGI